MPPTDESSNNENIYAFEKKLVEYSKQKLEKYKRMVDNPTVGKKTEKACNVATGFSCVTTIAAGIATGVVGVLPVAAAVPLAIAGSAAVLVVNVVGKHVIKNIRKRKSEIIIQAKEKAKSDSGDIMEQTGKELSRIYKEQLSMLSQQLSMLNLEDSDLFDRNTLLTKVLVQEGSKGVVKKQELETKPGVTSDRKKWHTPSVFWKPEIERDLKINKKYGFRAKFLSQDDGGKNTSNPESGENRRLLTATRIST